MNRAPSPAPGAAGIQPPPYVAPALPAPSPGGLRLWRVEGAEPPLLAVPAARTRTLSNGRTIVLPQRGICYLPGLCGGYVKVVAYDRHGDYGPRFQYVVDEPAALAAVERHLLAQLEQDDPTGPRPVD